ncbi:Di-copper centre-containing protein, partial [Violaceomyces palustris]
CDQPKVRVNWFSLTNQQRRSWQRAFMNLSRKPGCYWNVYNTRLDDFVLAHITQGKRIHFTSSFLPWHALFVDLFYDEMAKAGYDGPAVYYDWTHDA